MKDNVIFVIVGAIYVACLYTLVRPGSKGTQLVGTIGTTMSDLVRGVSGETYSSNTQKWSVGS
jgi:hypothetical protein